MISGDGVEVASARLSPDAVGTVIEVDAKVKRTTIESMQRAIWVFIVDIPSLACDLCSELIPVAVNGNGFIS
jgi:hypothetical protein